MSKKNSIQWKKAGLIFKPNKNFSWMRTHAGLPIADHIRNDLYKIYFSTRDSNYHASVAYVEIDINNPQNILKISDKPVLEPGKLGTFDENGVMAHSIVNFKGKKYMYYTGWNQRTTVPFHWSIGLAISSDNGRTFKKYSEGPILERNTTDPLFVASPTVILENKTWKMWYLSGTGWANKTSPKISYHIRYTESIDGIHWKRDGHVAINFKKNESRIGRAAIFKGKEFYRMWYSYAKKNYKIGYAESIDGHRWVRKDGLAGIDVSDSGWDSEMIEYPFVFVHKGIKYLLYNGNEYGKTGFGLAISD
jgi:predicted GH43/DUF377 family glycosyl hydrolase